MEQVKVVVAASYDKQAIPVDLKRIIDISPRIKVTDVSQLLAQEQGGDLSARGEFDAVLNGADVIFAARLPDDVLRRAPRLKWVQMMGAGVERFLDKNMVSSPVIMTNVSGIHAVPISEYILCVMLMFVKQMHLYCQMKQEKQWKRCDATVLRGRTIGIVGLGHIGRELARLSKSFGMNVIATRRSATEDSKARHVDRLIPRQRLPELLSESDFVALTLPSTPETTHLIAEKELRLMKSTSVIINIGRGNIIDEEALIRALEEHWIAGAGLDVFTREPLPRESKLWNLPNVIFSPHISGAMEDYFLRATDVFCNNLIRFLKGKRLLHVVNKKRGY
jgi:phosphoglycerate dehydrogenase-like enzyme